MNANLKSDLELLDDVMTKIKRKIKRREYKKEYNFINKDKISKQEKDRYIKNKDIINKRNTEYYNLNKDIIKERHREYKKSNKDKIKEQNKEYRNSNKGKANEYRAHRMKVDPFFRFKYKLRTLIRNSIRSRGFSKKSKTFQIIGCSFEEAISHFQSKFTEGMTLANHGLWHIDHIIPMSTAKTEEEAIRLNHISNLQPLWADDNLSKSDKLDWRR